MVQEFGTAVVMGRGVRHGMGMIEHKDFRFVIVMSVAGLVLVGEVL